MEILERSNIKIEQIEQIEFIGGGHRIPAIKEKIAQFVPEKKIGIHLNGDDVIAFGAGIIASDVLGLVHSYGSIRKKIFLDNNGHNFEIKIKISNKEIIDEEKEKYCPEEDFKGLAYDCIRKINKNGTIFKIFYNFTLERSVSFNHDSDIKIELYQEGIQGQEEKFLIYHLKNINSKILPDLKKENPTLLENLNDIKMKLILNLDKLGMISLRAEMLYKIETFYTLVKQQNKNGKYEFKYLPSKPTELTQEEKDAIIDEVQKSRDYSEDEKTKIKKIINSGDVNVKSKIENRKRIIPSIKTYVVTEEVFPYPLSKEQIQQAKNVLKFFDDYEKEHLKYFEQKNLLESILYSKKEWINNKELNKQYAKEDELNAFSELVTKIDEWYNANGDNSKTATIESKIKEIKDGFKLFNERIEKQKKRNTSIKYFKSEISSALKQGRNWIQEKPWIETYFNNEFKNFTNDLIDWIEDLERQQSALTEYEEQIITKPILDKKIDLLKEEVKKMKQLPRPGTKTDL